MEIELFDCAALAISGFGAVILYIILCEVLKMSNKDGGWRLLGVIFLVIVGACYKAWDWLRDGLSGLLNRIRWYWWRW
jgi:hypothetical protein